MTAVLDVEPRVPLLKRQHRVCDCGHFAHVHDKLTGRCQASMALGGKPTCGCKKYHYNPDFDPYR
jgi:hypothetical protein